MRNKISKLFRAYFRKGSPSAEKRGLKEAIFRAWYLGVRQPIFSKKFLIRYRDRLFVYSVPSQLYVMNVRGLEQVQRQFVIARGRCHTATHRK